MRTKTEFISPEIATQLLEKNTHNRRISESTVQSYAMDMKNNRWSLTHQGIAIDINGTIQDGQHRLWAVVFSGKTIEFNVSRDCPVEQIVEGRRLVTMDAIDRVRVRSTGQQLGLSHGIKNGSVVAATCRAIAIMVYPHMAAKRLSTANTLVVLEQYQSDIETIVEIMPTAYLRTSYILGPLSMYHHGEHEKAVEIARQLFSLENMSSPIRTFRKYIEANSDRSKQEKAIRIMARCILAFHKGENLSKASDSDDGVKFLVGMYPSIGRKIRETMTPCRISATAPRESLANKL